MSKDSNNGDVPIQENVEKCVSILNKSISKRGFSSDLENYFSNSNEDRNEFNILVKGIWNKIKSNQVLSANFIEVISMFDPADCCAGIINEALNFKDPIIQENAINAIEKWGNPNYSFILKHKHYYNADIAVYAKDVLIDFEK